MMALYFRPGGMTMSEYQYYKSQALDHPLTREEMAEVHALSTRAAITPTRSVNVCHWSDFKGDPLELVKQYCDAFLYVANWCPHQLMLRLPTGLLAHYSRKYSFMGLLDQAGLRLDGALL